MAKVMKTESGDPIDHSALSRMIHGKRQITIFEAEQLARLLEVPLNDVLFHAGIKTQAPQFLIDTLKYYAAKPDGARAKKALERLGV